MKTIKSVITSAFMLLLCLSSYAQWAGEDKEVLREPDNSQVVTIGVPDGSSDKCYEWTGPNILTDAHQSTIRVNPQTSEETYIVTRTSSCGVEQDQVVVRMKDSVTLVSVAPLKDCFNSGDNLTLEDFRIVTDPIGYQSMVQISPSRVTNLAGASDELQDITFRLTYNNHTSTKTTTVNVFNENLGVSQGQSVDFHNFISGLKKVNAMVEKAKKLSDKLNSIARGASPCQPDFHLVYNFPQSMDIHACCNGEMFTGYKVDYPSIDAYLGIDCYFPTSLKIPAVGGVDIHVGAAVGVKLGPLSFTYKRDCSNITIPLDLYVNISGGVRVSLLDPDFLSGELNLVGTGRTQVVWTVGKSIDWHPINVDLMIVGKVTLVSFYTKEIDYQIFTCSFFN